MQYIYDIGHHLLWEKALNCLQRKQNGKAPLSGKSNQFSATEVSRFRRLHEVFARFWRARQRHVFRENFDLLVFQGH